MRVKSLLGIAIIGFALPFGAMAGMDADDKAEKIAEKLNLDEARSDQVKDILKDYHEGKKSLKDQKKDRLKQVLTEEEMDKLKEMHDKKDGHHDKKDMHHDKKDRY